MISRKGSEQRAAEPEIDDLDVEEPAAETVKGGGGEFSTKGNIKF